MSKATVYGIKNCDTIKKAIAWLDAQNVAFTFHDYKTQGVDEDVLRSALDQCGWEEVINRRGTTWRKLSDTVKNTMNAEAAFSTACENPSIIKRPLLVYKDKTHLGFTPETYSQIF